MLSEGPGKDMDDVREFQKAAEEINKKEYVNFYILYKGTN